MMLHECRHGYTITADEAAAALAGVGCGDMRGLPVDEARLSSSEQMSAVRSLIEKRILRREDGEYRLNEPFGRIFKGMARCERAVTLFSKNSCTEGYVCYTVEDGLAVWEASMYGSGRFAVYYTRTEDFIEKLKDDGFISPLPVCSANIAKNIDERFREAYARFKAGEAQRGERIAYAAVSKDFSGGDTRILAASFGEYGSIVTEERNGVLSHSDYSESLFCRKLYGILENKDR